MTGKRLICSGCRRPEQVCLCDSLVRLNSDIQVTIWQDPVEAKHALSTAPLLHLSIEPSALHVGEQFSFAELFGNTDPATVAVLYPFSHKPALTESGKSAIRHLLVLDGTWRKVRKMLLVNPWLMNLSHIMLQPQQASEYHIRTSPREDGLSSIEAAVSALNWLSDGGDFSTVLPAFRRMVEIQQSFGHKK